uniref:DDE_Tnp_1_7 domain-containing protein n=1 Tax=Strongyloides venezuelensis TaxID=75913 RepID=A0A0K0G2N3_STRVS
MQEKIVDHTNECMSEKNISEQLTLNEFQGFIGCLLYLGCQHSSSFNIKKFLKPILRDTMQTKRFNEIISSLRFENICVTNQMKSKDKGFSVRWIEKCFDEISSNTYFSKSYTLDENLHRVKSRCQFLKYIPTKPDRIGLKTHVLASSSIRYVVSMELYTGTRLNEDNIVIPNSGTEVAKRFATKYIKNRVKLIFFFKLVIFRCKNLL